MTTLFDSTRRANVAASTFGHGLVTTPPTYRFPGFIRDLDWAAHELNQPSIDYDIMAEDAANDERLCRGIVFA